MATILWILWSCVTCIAHDAPNYAQDTTYHAILQSRIIRVNMVIIATTNWAAILWVLWRHTDSLCCIHIADLNVSWKHFSLPLLTFNVGYWRQQVLQIIWESMSPYYRQHCRSHCIVEVVIFFLPRQLTFSVTYLKTTGPASRSKMMHL